MRRVQLFVDGDAKPAIVATDQTTGWTNGTLPIRRLAVGWHKLRVKGVTVTGLAVSSPIINFRVRN